MRKFNFDRLIDKYSCDFTVSNIGKGHYNDMGDWVAGDATNVAMKGAIISISDGKIYRSNGVLTTQDKELFTKESLGDIDKACVYYNGNKYKVESNPQNNSNHTGVWQYILKWVSAFKE